MAENFSMHCCQRFKQEIVKLRFSKDLFGSFWGAMFVFQGKNLLNSAWKIVKSALKVEIAPKMIFFFLLNLDNRMYRQPVTRYLRDCLLFLTPQVMHLAKYIRGGYYLLLQMAPANR